MTRLIDIYLRDLKAGEHACRFIMLGPVVRKAVNANLGLRCNQDGCFSCFKRVFKQITSDCLIATEVKM